jgi:hypothetical protein
MHIVGTRIEIRIVDLREMGGDLGGAPMTEPSPHRCPLLMASAPHRSARHRRRYPQRSE